MIKDDLRNIIWRKENGQVSESYVTGLLMAMVGGYLQTYTYVGRGGVFASAQTGNMVLMGVSLYQGQILQSLRYLAPIVVFFLGIYLAEAIRDYAGKWKLFHWRQGVLLLQMAALFGTSFLPYGKWDILASVIISFGCALQTETFRSFEGSAMLTTMCTGNLRTATENLYHYRKGKKRDGGKESAKYFGIIIAFILAAVAGAAGTKRWGETSVRLPVLMLGMVFCLMFLKKERDLPV